jgi:hypothetical protein
LYTFIHTIIMYGQIGFFFSMKKEILPIFYCDGIKWKIKEKWEEKKKKLNDLAFSDWLRGNV